MAKKITQEEFDKLIKDSATPTDSTETFKTIPLEESFKPNVYDIMRADQPRIQAATMLTAAGTPIIKDVLKQDDTIIGKYGVSDFAYDMFIDPALVGVETISGVTTDLLLKLDQMAIDSENNKRTKGGSPLLAQPGESIAGKLLTTSKLYVPEQFSKDLRALVAAARDEPDPNKRWEIAKNIAGEYGSFYTYLFGGLELAKKIPYLKLIAKPVDKTMRKAILGNPQLAIGTDVSGIAAETEVKARGGSELQQIGAGVTASIASPSFYNLLKRSIFRKANKEIFQNLKPKDFEQASKLIQQISDPEVGIQNLENVLQSGTIPNNVRAPLEILLGDEGYTYFESVLGKSSQDGVINLNKRDKEFLQGLNNLLKPVTQGQVKNAEDWFRLSSRLFNENMNATTQKITQEGFEELNKITNNLPTPEEVSTSIYNSLNESKEVFGELVDEAWDITDLTKPLPKSGLFDDFTRIVKSPSIDINPSNINNTLNKFTYLTTKGKTNTIKSIDEDFLIRLNTDDILARQQELRQGVVEASKGNVDQLKKFDSFINFVNQHQQKRTLNRIPTGNAFSDPEAMRLVYGNKYLADVAQDVSIPFESSTMKNLQQLANDYGIDNLPLSAKELLNGERKINTIGDLYNLRRTLGVEGMGQMPSGQPNQQAFFANKLRTAILDDLSKLPDEGNVALKRAISFSRDYNQTFKSGIVGKILGLDKDGSRLDPRLAMQKVFTSAGNNLNLTGKINTEKLLEASKEFSLTPAGDISRIQNKDFSRDLTDYMVNLFVNAPGNVKADVIQPGSGQKFYNKYKSILDLPEMKRAKGIVLNASGDTSVIAKMLDEKTSMSRVYAGYFGNESIGAVNAFLGGDITEGLSKMMMSKGGIEQLKDLKRLVNSKEIPDEFFTSQGITRKDVLEGIKDSVRIGLIKIGQQGESPYSYSILKDLVLKGQRNDDTGRLLVFLREAGFSGTDIAHVQKFADEIEKYNKYLVTRANAGQSADPTKMDNIFYTIIGLFAGGVGADLFRSGSSLAAASYIKNQTKNTLQRLSSNQVEQILSDAMGDPKLLRALLETPTHFNKNQIAKKRPYLLKYLTGKGLDATFFAAPSDEEIAERMKISDAPGIIEQFLNNQTNKAIDESTINSLFAPSNQVPGLNQLDLNKSDFQINNNMLNNLNVNR